MQRNERSGNLPVHNFVPCRVRNSVKTTSFLFFFFFFFFTAHVSEEEIRLLGQVDFPQERCINYLTPDEAHEEIRAAWQNREYSLFFSFLLRFISTMIDMITIARLISIYGDWKLNQYSIIFNVSPHGRRIARIKLLYWLLIEILQ